MTAPDRTTARPPRPTIRRTLSLDAIVAPYLQGHWPKEAEIPAITCVNDKATQVNMNTSGHSAVCAPRTLHPRDLLHHVAGRRKKISRETKYPRKEKRRRTQALGLMGQLRSPVFDLFFFFQTPLNRLAPRLRRSVEGLNLELEEAFVSEKPEDQHEILDIPDGHRAPVPVQRCSSGSQSEPSPVFPSFLAEPADCETACPAPSTPLPSFALDPPLLQPCSSAPRPSKTYSFQREPPEGCERVRVCEEGTSACQDEPLLQPSCPDPNKVNFTPHGGSAFCPVSLLKPLLPSMDLLFRGLSVSPVTGCPGQASPTRHLGTQ
uniref:Family with sequence similarity 117 member Aa n=1 Tax=Gasterosteus aculeatus aculeatus TaxID=481459 RepID=A0AAQ4PF97_GASAC